MSVMIQTYQGPVLLPDSDGDCCEGCGMVDPAGTHYEDCRLLEPGDLLVPVSLRGPDGVPVRQISETLPAYQGPCRVCQEEGVPEGQCSMCDHAVPQAVTL